jgi:hypothetical protein
LLLIRASITIRIYTPDPVRIPPLPMIYLSTSTRVRAGPGVGCQGWTNCRGNDAMQCDAMHGLNGMERPPPRGRRGRIGLPPYATPKERTCGWWCNYVLYNTGVTALQIYTYYVRNEFARYCCDAKV